MNAGGIYTGTRTTFVEKMAFATGSSAVPHGDLTSARSVSSAGSDGYQALQVGGNAGPGNGGRLNKIEKLNFGYNAVSVEVDQLVAEKSNQFAASDSVDLMTGCGVFSSISKELTFPQSHSDYFSTGHTKSPRLIEHKT